MNYESMSDFEINKAVATAWLPCDYDFNEKEKTIDLVEYVTYLGGHGTPEEGLEKYGEFNPCEIASDAWKIILDNKINICFGSELVTAKLFTDNKVIEVVCKNPLRAAMIVFLMMNESK